jgi:transposase InsO family protein
MAAADIMSQLIPLYEELGFPSAEKLYVAARRQGMDVTRAQAEAVAKGSGVAQINAPGPTFKGKIAAAAPQARWQADLIDFTATRSLRGERYILVVMDVFSRKLWARALENKESEDVAWEFEDIVREAGEKPEELTTDQGLEFTGRPFKEAAARLEITLVTKRAMNDIATLDRAIQTIKGMIFRDIERRGADVDWGQRVAAVIKGYNRRPSGALMNASPQDVWHREAAQPKDPVTSFRLLAQEGLKMRQNDQTVRRRAETLEEAGAFRVALPKDARGFRPKWSSDVRQVDEVQYGRVKDTTGAVFDTKLVRPTDPDAERPTVPQRLRGGSDALQAKRAEELMPFKVFVVEFLSGEEKPLRLVRGFLAAVPGWDAAYARSRAPNLQTALQAMGLRTQTQGRGRDVLVLPP